MKQNLQLYIHIPFCVRKCGYCDFLSAPASEEMREAYVQALIAEIASVAKRRCHLEYLPDIAAYSVSTVFIGGGTPSLLTGEQISRIMKALRVYFYIEERAEISLEANPGTLTKEKLLAYQEAGINRLSLGLQSVHNRELLLLGRIHSFQDFLNSYDLARKAGFSNINVDLMFALPGQRFEDWEESLRTAAELKSEHLSVYNLILEKGTPFYEQYGNVQKPHTREGDLPDEETERLMYQCAAEILTSYGFHRYEISNYAMPGFECIHNKGYWTRENYLGFGLGSASLIGNVRFSNAREWTAYIRGCTVFLDSVQRLDPRTQMEEFMFLGLRLTEGVSEAGFCKKFGVDLHGIYGSQAERLKSQKFLIEKDGRMFLTEEGIFLSNYALSEFLFD